MTGRRGTVGFIDLTLENDENDKIKSKENVRRFRFLDCVLTVATPDCIGYSETIDLESAFRLLIAKLHSASVCLLSHLE